MRNRLYNQSISTSQLSKMASTHPAQLRSCQQLARPESRVSVGKVDCLYFAPERPTSSAVRSTSFTLPAQLVYSLSLSLSLSSLPYPEELLQSIIGCLLLSPISSVLSSAFVLFLSFGDLSFSHLRRLSRTP